MKQYIEPKKVAASLVGGWLALICSPYIVILDHIYKTRFVWPLLFPILIAVAWEPVYAYITGLGGLIIALPFMVSPERGWGNLLIGFLYLLLLITCGHFCNRSEKHRINYYLIFVLYCAIYYTAMIFLYPRLLLLNRWPNELRAISPIINRVQAISVVFSILALAALIRILLSLPWFRKSLWLEPLPYSEKNNSLCLLTIVVLSGFFLLDWIFEAFYFSGRGLHTSVFSISFGQIVKLPMILAAACMICDAMIYNTMRNTESHDKLMRSEERYRMIFQHNADAYFEIDNQGIVLKVNPAIYSNLGFTPQEILGQHIGSLFADPPQISLLLDRLFDGEQVTNVEMSGLLGNKELCSLLVSGNVMRLGGQKLAVVTARNISDYKKAEERRWELSALLNAIFESNKDFIWTVDCKSFSLIAYNRAFARFIQESYQQEIHFGSRLRDIFPIKDAKLFESYYRQVLQTGDFSVEYTAASGIILNLNFYPVRLHGEVSSIAVFTRNITAQKRAERKIVELNAGLEQTVEERTRELRRAYHDLESFSHTVTHEFKTPIREIGTYLEIIQEDNYDQLGEQSKADIQLARKVCNQTLDMIENMMIYTKAGFMVLNIEKIDMMELVKNCFKDLQQANEDKKIELQLNDLPDLYSDRFLLRMAIMNVLNNSIKFAQNRPVIQLVAGHMESEKEIAYYFKDNGVGFDMSNAKGLFKLFNRAHNSSDYEGNGIGLALVKRILSRNGGYAEIIGEKDRGCVVVFIFQRKYQPFPSV